MRCSHPRDNHQLLETCQYYRVSLLNLLDDLILTGNSFRIPSEPISESNQTTTPDVPHSPTADLAAWVIIEEYASGIIDTYPEVEEKLVEYLGINYWFCKWQEAFKATDSAEDNTAAAISLIKMLSSKALNPTQCSPSSSSLSASHTPWPHLPQLEALENVIMEGILVLQRKGHIWGTPLTLEEGFEFPGGDHNIIDKVTGWTDSKDEESKSENDEDMQAVEITKLSEALAICAHMEQLCLEYVSPDINVVSLQSQIWKLWAHFCHLDNESHVQTSLKQFWTKTHTNEDFSML